MSVLSLIFNSLGNVESSKDISTKHYNETLKTIRSELKIYAKKNVVPGFEKVIEKNQYERGSEKYGGGCLNKITEKMTVLKLDGEKVISLFHHKERIHPDEKKERCFKYFVWRKKNLYFKQVFPSKESYLLRNMETYISPIEKSKVGLGILSLREKKDKNVK